MQLNKLEFDRLPQSLRLLFVKLPNPGRASVLTGFPDTETHAKTRSGYKRDKNLFEGGIKEDGGRTYEGDSGSAARFFTQAEFTELDQPWMYTAKADGDDRLGSKHPTVKPLDLIQWLCRLITPPGGTILDCFAGTGTTGEAAFREGFNAVLIEREADYLKDIERRMGLVKSGKTSRKHASEKAKAREIDHGPLFVTQPAASRINEA